MQDKVAIAQLRRRIMEAKGLRSKPQTRKLVLIADEPLFPKSSKMKYIEVKYGVLIEREIFYGSLSAVVTRFGNEVDRSTVSRWRKIVQSWVGKVSVSY